jgi:hypothetical protein
MGYYGYGGSHFGWGGMGMVSRPDGQQSGYFVNLKKEFATSPRTYKH